MNSISTALRISGLRIRNASSRLLSVSRGNFDKHPIYNEKKALRVLVTGAAGQIGYSILPRLARGDAFGANQPVHLVLNDIPAMKNVLEGVRMELEDCAFGPYAGCDIICDAKEAYKGIDVAVMLANLMELTATMSRAELLKENKKLYEEIGKAISESANQKAKFLMIANPANTNCLMLIDSIKSIPSRNFTCLTRLDHNRTKEMVAGKLGVPPSDVRKIVVWGNHSSTMFPDLSFAEVKNSSGEWRRVIDVLKDEKWGKEILPPIVQRRFTAIIETRKKSSALSAANAGIDHLHNWFLGTPENDWVSMGVLSEGQYNLPKGIVFGSPCRCVNGNYEIVKDLHVSDFIREKMNISAEELMGERKVVIK